MAKYIKKIEKKAQDRKQCIKKLYNLLENREKEIDMLRTKDK